MRKQELVFSGMQFLEVQGVSLLRNGRYAVREIHFSLAPQTRLAIAGETGSGKSSLLRMIAGLEQPHSGAVYFEGKRVLGPQEVLIPGCKGIGYLSQYFELRNHYRVWELLDMANLLATEVADNIIRMCEVDDLLQRCSHELSGGEKQRVALAAVLLYRPRLLLLDEPFSNADPIHKAHMKAVLARVEAEMQITMVWVTHDPADVLPWATELIVLQNGQVVQQGSPQKLFHAPVNPYCAGLLGSYTLLDLHAINGWASLRELQPPGKQLLVRPGYLHVQQQAGNPAAVVQNISYYGNYYLLDATIGNQWVQIVYLDKPPAVGQIISLQYQHDAPWFV